MSVALEVSRFSFSDEPQYAGMRGVRLDAETGYSSGIVFATAFPTVYVTDSGDVEVGGFRVPSDVAAEWLRAVADYLGA